MPKANTGDIQIYYEEHGRGQPLIMVLGLGQDIATWGFQIAEFSRHVRLIVLDNRDSGKSSRCSDNYTTKSYLTRSSAAFERQLNANIRHDTRGPLHQIQIPTLILSGKDDELTPP